MKIRVGMVLLACVVVGLALLSGCNKAELAKLRTDLNQVTNDKSACDAKLGDSEKAKAELLKQKSDLEGQVQALTGQVAQLKAESEQCKAAAAVPAKGAEKKDKDKEDDKKGKKKGKK